MIGESDGTRAAPVGNLSKKLALVRVKIGIQFSIAAFGSGMDPVEAAAPHV
jgi:hypothetical protein